MPSKSAEDEAKKGPGFAKRAKPDKLLEVFNKYASIEKNGEKLMSYDDFVRRYLGLFEGVNFNADAVKLLASLVDTNGDGDISYSEFDTFEGFLCYPDALYKTVFRLFDVKGKGTISYNDFVEVISKTELYQKIPFNLESPFLDLYFGKNKTLKIPYGEFCQFLHDFYEECAIEGFRRADKSGTGSISLDDFETIMISTKNYMLNNQVQSVLSEAAAQHNSGRKVTLPYFNAFSSLLEEIETAKRIYLNITGNKHTKDVTKEEFMHTAQAISRLKPLEVEILFQLCYLLHQKGKIVYDDLNAISNDQMRLQIGDALADAPVQSRGVLLVLAETIYRFLVGFIAGGIGATAVFPIDLVKTRIQNQRTKGYMEEAVYKGYIDCFLKVLRYEGFFGLYRGLFPQLVGVSPEKATKLTVNDFVRDKFYDKEGNIPYYAEVLAGACAGCSQVVITNPLEIVKIRLQVSGEVAGGSKIRARDIVRDLGIKGLYKGVRACLMRDVTFASIYFSTYANVKRLLADDTGYNKMWTLFAAGICAGVPAAGTATPFDVIKTRIQVIPRKGQTTYDGVIDAATKIYKEEGPMAFTKGALARCCRSAPQMAITLFTYELIQRFFWIDFGGKKPVGSEHKVKPTATQLKSKNPDHIGGYSAAVPIFVGIENRFGICFPKFSTSNTVKASSKLEE